MEDNPAPRLMKLLERERGKSMRDILRELADQGLDQGQMAANLGVSEATICGWLRLHNARRRYEIPVG